MIGFASTVLLLVIAFPGVIFGEREWDKMEFDFIVVGAGAAGCAVAARLSENSKHHVLVLEAGGEPQTFIDIPYFSRGPFRGKLDWSFYSESETNAFLAFENERSYLPQGRGLGGSTLINGMKYTRGNKRDYDHWRDLGNPGWGYKDVLPYFKKLETFQGKVTTSSLNYHGYTGPVTVTPTPFKPVLTDAVIKASEEMGYKEVDYDAEQQKGASGGFFNLRNGFRLSAYKAYLENHRNRTNLHIVTNALVFKVEFRKNRAIGVVFEYEGKEQRARAKKEVVISAGAINSPKILQLSGIGPKNILDKFKIPVTHELGGVGKNLQNHVSVTGLEILLKDQIGFRYDKDLTSENFEKLENQGNGPLTVPLRTLGLLFFDSDYANKSIDWPDLEFSINQIPYDVKYKKEYALKNENTFCENRISMRPFLLRPKSVGEVKIKSENPHDHPLIKLNYLSERDDVLRLVSGVRLFLQFISTRAFQKYGATATPFPVIKSCDKYEILSDEYLECFVRAYSGTSFHMSGTCKMGPRNDVDAVVDSRLRVHGVHSLRVIDTSICPTVISGHTMAPTIMIGEKGADMIKRKWRNYNTGRSLLGISTLSFSFDSRE